MSESNFLEKPKTSGGDIAHTIAKAGLSAIPIVGGSAAEIFGLLITPPLTKRRDKWVESIAEGLKELEGKAEGFSIENLAGNEMFITTVMHATQAATRNHQKEKIEALRNAVLNAALPNAPDEDVQLMFLNLIDTFTGWHLRILKFFNDPAEWNRSNDIASKEYSMGGLSTILEDSFPELHGRRDFYDLITTELHSKGLFNTSSLHVTMSGHGLWESRTTSLGKRFLAFITEPDI